MKVLIGAYSQLSQGVPVPAFERALTAVIKPMLTLLHHSEGSVLQLSLGVPVLEWLELTQQPVNLLLADLARQGKIEFLTGSYHQSILNLISPKDRSNQVELTTTYLRKRYGQRSKTMFSYAQVFNPNYINTMNLCCVDSLVISSYDCDKPKQQFSQPFSMQEMGKSISVIPTSSPINSLVQKFGAKEISFGNLLDQIRLVFEARPQFIMAMVNIDQLLQGGISEEQTVQLFTTFLHYGSQSIEEIHGEQELPPKGYLQAGWYGFDSIKSDLCCINELFVKDESFAYMYGRYTSMVETARSYKKDKDVRKRLEQLIQKMSTGAVYLCDANATMLRSSVRKLFWRYISEADSVLAGLNDFSYPVITDFDRDALDEYLAIGKYLSCVVDSKGGSLAELTYLPSLYNYGDTLSVMKGFGSTVKNLHQTPPGRKQRLFTDVFLPHDSVLDEYSKTDEHSCLDMSNAVYSLSVLDRRNTEYRAVASTGRSAIINGELEISKHFKLRQNTVLLDVTLTNLSEHPVSFLYGCEIPLSIASFKNRVSFFQLESKKNVLHEEEEIILEHVKSIRMYDEPNSTSLTLVADARFTLLKEDYTIEKSTILGVEQLYQHTLFMTFWPIQLESGAERRITLGLRVERK